MEPDLVADCGLGADPGLFAEPGTIGGLPSRMRVGVGDEYVFGIGCFLTLRLLDDVSDGINVCRLPR